MWFIKTILLFFIFFGSASIGIMLSNRYKNRTNELYEIKKGLNYFKSKIEYTYEPLKEIFLDISNNLNYNIGNIFKIASLNMEKMSAEYAWRNSIELSENCLNKNDLEIIKSFGKTLGQTDIQGQLNKTNLTLELIERQIEDATKEQNKNEKLYKTLGFITGMGLVIILI